MDKRNLTAETFNLASKFSVGHLPYGRYSSVYFSPTSNMREIVNCYDGFSSVLSVGAAGGLAFECVLKGAKKVDCFDINELQVSYFEIIETVIKNLKYEEFIKYFSSDFGKLLDSDFYYMIEDMLSVDASRIWGSVYEYYYSDELLKSDLFRTKFVTNLEYLKMISSYYNADGYNRLQSILRSEEIEINYDACDVKDLFNKYKGNKYDLILLDNIFQYRTDILGLETIDSVDSFIKNDLASLLTEKGKIQVNCGYQGAADAVKIHFNLPASSKYEAKNDIFTMAEVLVEMTEGTIVPLIKKGGYEYKFISGVETNNKYKSENVVLTYSKKK